MNSVNLIGRMTKDIEIFETGTSKIGKFSIAVNDGYGDNQKSYFFEVITWNKTAENMEQYTGKGSKIAVSGKLQQDTWEKEGKNYSKVIVNAFQVMFLDNKEEEKVKTKDFFVDALKEDKNKVFNDAFDNFEMDESDLPF